MTKQLALRMFEATAVVIILVALAWVWPSTVEKLAYYTILSNRALLSFVIDGILLWGCLGPLIIAILSCWMVHRARRLNYYPLSLAVYFFGLVAGVILCGNCSYCLLVMIVGTLLGVVESHFRKATRAAASLWISAGTCSILYYLFLVALQVGKAV